MSRCGSKVVPRWVAVVSVLGVVAVMASGVDASGCAVGSYDDGTGGCQACPVGLTTLQPGANSSDACVCSVGSFKTDAYDTNLIAHYGFDGDTRDLQNPGNVATLTGNGGIAYLDTTHKIFGSHSVKLTNDDGLKTYLLIPQFQLDTSLTINLWFRWDVTSLHDSSYTKLFWLSGDLEIYAAGDSSVSGDGEALYFVMYDQNNNRIEYKNSDRFYFNNNVWYHVSWVVNKNSEMRVFVDGEYVPRTNTDRLESGKFPLWGASANMNNNRIGTHASHDDGRDSIDGHVEEFRLYNTALPDSAVKALYEARGAPCTSCPSAMPYTDPSHGATAEAQCQAAAGNCVTLDVSSSPAASEEGDVTSSMVKYLRFPEGSSSYTLNFPTATSGEVLVVSGTEFLHLPGVTFSYGEYTVTVGGDTSVITDAAGAVVATSAGGIKHTTIEYVVEEKHDTDNPWGFNAWLSWATAPITLSNGAVYNSRPLTKEELKALTGTPSSPGSGFPKSGAEYAFHTVGPLPDGTMQYAKIYVGSGTSYSQTLGDSGQDTQNQVWVAEEVDPAYVNDPSRYYLGWMYRMKPTISTPLSFQNAITGVLQTYTSPQVILRYNAIVCPTTDTDKPACDEGVSVFSYWSIRKC